jgi:hypothetical protein
LKVKKTTNTTLGWGSSVHGCVGDEKGRVKEGFNFVNLNISDGPCHAYINILYTALY